MLNDNLEMQTTKPHNDCISCNWNVQCFRSFCLFDLVCFDTFFPRILVYFSFICSNHLCMWHSDFRIRALLFTITHSSVASVYMHRNWIQLSHPFELSHITGLLIFLLSLSASVSQFKLVKLFNYSLFV